MEKNETKITDWIQAIAALFAITGTIVGFVVLGMRDTDKQRQIEDLSILAKAAQQQVMALQQQVAKMDSQYALGKRQLQLNEDIAREENKLRVKALQPYFVVEARKNVKGGPWGGPPYSWFIELGIKNTGGTAKKVKVSVSNSQSEPTEFTLIKNYEEVTCHLQLDSKYITEEITMQFLDLDNRKYEQKLIIKKRGEYENPTLSELIEPQRIN